MKYRFLNPEHLQVEDSVSISHAAVVVVVVGGESKGRAIPCRQRTQCSVPFLLNVGDCLHVRFVNCMFYFYYSVCRNVFYLCCAMVRFCLVCCCLQCPRYAYLYVCQVAHERGYLTFPFLSSIFWGLGLHLPCILSHPNQQGCHQPDISFGKKS